MCLPSVRRYSVASLTALVALLVGPSTALAQRGTDTVRAGEETAASLPWYAESIATAGLVLVLGTVLLVIVPDTTRRCTDRALESPGLAFLYGLGSLLGVVGLSVALAITIVGLVLAVPLLFGFFFASMAATTLGYLVIGRLVADDPLPVLGVGTAVAAVAGGVPVLGDLLGFVILTIGLGTIGMGVLERIGVRS